MTCLDKDIYYMQIALKEAEIAYECGEVPVGAVVVRDGEVISTGHNLREQNGIATAHAELLAIEDACRILGGWRLSGCTLYVTLEPCPMCAGAIINARLDRVFFGAYDNQYGSFDSVADFSALGYPNSPEIHGGILEEECKQILQEFFTDLRKEG